jgi:hypothetical protein
MKMDPNHFMWWFSEIDRNRVTVLVNEKNTILSYEAKKELEKRL